MHIICIGGGAASFFFAANLSRKGHSRLTILEQGRKVMSKVAISGGGRCNVTHACYDPLQLIEHYPRGNPELLEAFKRFGPSQTVQWFESRGVKLKTEDDGRMFPVTDSSQTILDCLVRACRENGCEVRTGAKVTNIRPIEAGKKGYTVEVLNGPPLHADTLFLGPGNSKQVWQVLGHLGHTIIDPVPSLFTFQVSDRRITGLSGISVADVKLQVPGIDLASSGPLLITHKGLSGPAALRLSAFGARLLHRLDYRFDLVADFTPNLDLDALKRTRDTDGKKLLGNSQLLGLPKRLAQGLLSESGIDLQKKYASASNDDLEQLARAVKSATFRVHGQNRFKEEFVTAGGVDLADINMDDFSSRILENLYLAGEVLNVDGVTGGFNFQAAWTGAWLAAQAAGSRQ